MVPGGFDGGTGLPGGVWSLGLLKADPSLIDNFLGGIGGMGDSGMEDGDDSPPNPLDLPDLISITRAGSVAPHYWFLFKG